jgi:hypothetical protein
LDSGAAPSPIQERQALLLLTGLLVYFTGALIVLRETVLKLKFEWDRSFLDLSVQPMIKSPPVDRWLIPIMLIGRYAALLVAPIRLSIDYGLAVIRPTLSRSDPYFWAGLAVIILWLTATAICAARKKWVALFFLLAIAMTYSMASNVVIIGTIFGERLLYLPSAFFLLLVVTEAERIIDGLPTKAPARAAGAIVAILVVLGVVRTFTYIRRWNDREGLYTYALAQQPKSLKLHMLVSELDYEQYRLTEAQQVMADAEAIYPNYWELWKMSALIAERAGDWNAAAMYFKKAFDVQPSVGLENALNEAVQKRDAIHKTH